jgi:hypothetical protein
MVSDSDGKNFPWYGNKTEVVCIKGPQKTSTIHQITMNDNFHPHITWDLPMSDEAVVRLTRVKRDQKFLTWLVAMDVHKCEFIVLKTFKWRMNVEILIDPKREQGKRAILISEPIQKQPVLLKNNIRIPNCALYPSNANSSQILVWHSNSSIVKKPLVILGPKYYKHK